MLRLTTINQVIAKYRGVTNPCRTEEIGLKRYLFSEADGDFYMIVEALLDTHRRVWSVVERDGELLIGWGYHPECAIVYLITDLPAPIETGKAADRVSF